MYNRVGWYAHPQGILEGEKKVTGASWQISGCGGTCRVPDRAQMMA